MIKKRFFGIICLFVTAVIWGTSFVAQTKACEYIGPFTFNTFRFLISGTVLAIVYLFDYLSKPKNEVKEPKDKKVTLIVILTGLSLAFGANLQQIGISVSSSTSTQAFLSSFYILFVPLLGYFIKRKPKLYIYPILLMALFGSFLIAFEGGSFTFKAGDLITILCCVGFALQIFFVDLIALKVNLVKLCSIECLICGFVSSIFMLFLEPLDGSMIVKAVPYFLYAGLFAGCIAYLLQLFGQRVVEPTIASLLMSLESVFGLISCVLILKEHLGVTQVIGCIVIFLAIILAQIDWDKIFSKKTISRH